MELPKGVKEAFVEFEVAATDLGMAMAVLRANQDRLANKHAVLLADKKREAAAAALFEAINKMRRNDRRHGKEG